MLRMLLLLVAAVLMGIGALGLGLAYAEDHEAVTAGQKGFVQVYGVLADRVDALPGPGDALASLAGPLRFGLAPVGLILLVTALLPAGGGREEEGGDVDFEDEEGMDRKARRRTLKDAASIAKKGDPLEAAELCFAVGLLDEAANYFLEADEVIRVAEIRHDQNRFIESAELYAKAGSHDSAAVIFAGQGEYERAAGAYLEISNYSVAAEMYEQAGKHLQAADCYDKAEFPLAAAEAYLKCSAWDRAASTLDAALLDQSAAARSGDESARAEYNKLVKMCGYAHERAGSLEQAEATFIKGELFDSAAELAERRGDLERAADLFTQARSPSSAARVLKSLGRHQDASRIMAEHLRDKGDVQAAAEHFEQGGDLLEAGDLYRSVEAYEKAGSCYERYGEHAQAAEMFVQAGDRERAAGAYEAGRDFQSAAECFGLLGNSLREAEMLEMAGNNLRAGELHQEAGRIDAAIAAYQHIPSGHESFVEAAARLGAIFRDQGQLALATTKLREAIDGRDLDAETVGATFCLASVLELEQNLQEAAELYERVQAFDYNYKDAGARLERCRSLADARAESGFVTARANATGSSGRYEIESTLGRGGMGIVYKARDTVLDRPVAFKILPDSLRENPQALKNFLREAKSAAQLNHPNIVTVYDAGEQDGVFYIAMEFVDGNTLKDIIRSRGPIGAKGLIHVVSQLAEALAFAHEKKIVHRDIKTANAMWTRDRKAKIMDFGLAKVIEEVRNHTTVVSGTPYYMSPEQTLGKNVDHRTDIYSLGVSIFEMATGTLPFTEGNLPYHHVHTPPPDPRSLVPGLPEALSALILRCLEKAPEQRYQQASEIISDLRAIHASM
jgi:tetratricopeptide (TPR) repeat protein